LSEHEKSRFPLAGAHGAVVCRECHTSTPGAPGSAGIHFRFSDLSCTACHQDPHNGQFPAVATAGVAKPEWTCISCHTQDAWEDVSIFDHSATAFALTDAHRTIGCIQCHRSTAQQAGIQGVTFSSAPTSCAGCHLDVHGRQFDSAGGTTRCESCHTAIDWLRSLRFDHNRDSSFALTGAHEAVPCRLCHSEQRQAGGAITVYRGTPTRCEACHAN
jgi:hypothetical protein